MLLLLPLCGCFPGYLEEQYGRRSGVWSDSINGTAVLGKMIEKAGHKVRSVDRLYPKVGNADVIVWFCDDFGAPSAEARQWLDDWLLLSDEAKTLVFVTRDYEAGALYWSEMQKTAPAGLQKTLGNERRQSQTRFNQYRGGAPVTDAAGDWFTTDRRTTTRTIQQLSGPWAKGVDASKTQIEHRAYLTPSDEADFLLADERGHPLASEIVYSGESWQTNVKDSRVVMIENGAFLLNGALVNKEHRKLAGRLVDHLGPPKLNVVFLESDSDPPVLADDPSVGPASAFKHLTLWPIGAPIVQALALGVAYAAFRWPIFGRPRRGEEASLTDFGRHVEAVGRLLAATRDRTYADAQLRAYFQAAREKD
ncbi:MAG: hypothetical protein AAGJ46_00760 [Planctomycetota bacterium]